MSWFFRFVLIFRVRIWKNLNVLIFQKCPDFEELSWFCSDFLKIACFSSKRCQKFLKFSPAALILFNKLLNMSFSRGNISQSLKILLTGHFFLKFNRKSPRNEEKNYLGIIKKTLLKTYQNIAYFWSKSSKKLHKFKNFALRCLSAPQASIKNIKILWLAD